MMNRFTGDVRPLAADNRDDARLEAIALGLGSKGDEHMLVEGTEAQIKDLSRRVRLGNQELERRAKRRKDQRDSRRANR